MAHISREEKGGVIKVYLAAQYGWKERIKQYAKELQFLGVEVTSRWLEEKYSASTTLDQVRDQELAEFAGYDLEDVHNADTLIFFSVSPSTHTLRGGRHVEFGAALALGKEILVVGPKENIFHYLPGITHFPDWVDLKAYVQVQNVRV